MNFIQQLISGREEEKGGSRNFQKKEEAYVMLLMLLHCRPYLLMKQSDALGGLIAIKVYYFHYLYIRCLCIDLLVS